MKLRIFGDTLRLRLSQPEVQTLLAEGEVREAIHFGDRELVYRLCADGVAESIGAAFDGASIVVRIPTDRARAWASGDEVGIRTEQPLANDRALVILVEKDFKCLVPRTGEESYEGFPNPGTGSCA